MYRIKFFCGSVNQKNFLLRNGFLNETCILIHWKNSFQEFMGVGSKIWLQVQINDPEIGSHVTQKDLDSQFLLPEGFKSFAGLIVT